MPSQKLRLEAEMKDNASPAVKQLRAELSALQAASAEVNGTAKLNAELAKLQKEAEANASPAVRKLRAELAELQKGTAAQQAVASLNKEIAALRRQSGEIAPTAGMKGFSSWMDEAHGRMTGFVSSARDLPGILSGIGIGGIAAGGSIASLAAEMKKLGEQGLALKELSRQTGMSTEFVNSWSHAGEHFAVTGDTMLGMLDRFSGQLPDFNRGVGSMFKEFAQWPDLVRKMQHEGPAQALLDALNQAEQVGKEKGPQVRKQFLDAMGLGADAEKLFGDHGLVGLLAQLQKPWAAPSNDFTKQALELRDATSALSNSVVQLENAVGPGVLGGLTNLLKALGVQIDLFRHDAEWLKSVFSWLNQSSKAGAKAFDETKAAPMPSEPLPPPGSLRKSDPMEGMRAKKAAYDGAGFGGLLHNASFTTDAAPSPSSQFGVRGLVADGSKEGVLAALREWSLQSDAKGGLGGSSDGFGTDGGGGGHAGGRQGFSSRMGAPSGEGGRPFKGSPGVGGWWTSDHVQHAVDRLMKESHLSQAGAEGLVSRWATVEAAGGPTAVNPKSGAWGIGQWLGSRGGGRTADFDGQISKAVGELNGPEARAAQALRSAKNAREGAVGASIFERAEHYNARSGVDDWTSKSEAGAARIHDLASGASVGAGDGSVAAKDVGMHLHALNEQCVSLAKAAVGASGSVHEWRRGVGALAGTLKPGTPVATFLDRYGRTTDRYAGGGNGTPGAHLDHAGIFQSYIRDKAGAIVGMNIAEQYQGSHGVHSKAYYNRGWGEGNASNYHAINGPDGRPLGGERNPLNRRATELAQAPHPNAGRRASGLPSTAHAAREGDSNHLLTIDLRDPGGHVKSTRIERNGPLKVDMPNRWQTGRNPLIGA